MTLVSDPTSQPRLPSTQEDQDHPPSSDPSYYFPPPLLTPFPTIGASPEAAWDDDVPAAESEEEAEWEDDFPEAESEDAAAAKVDTVEPDSPPRWWPSNSARRDPRKAELFRSLEAASEARRLQEARRRKPPPLPTGTGDTNVPICPPESPYWRHFRELRATRCGPANPVLNPDENSLSRPPSNESNEMLSGKVVDQHDDTEHSSESASSDIVPYGNSHGENPLPVPPKGIKHSIDSYAVQCGKCWKWRLVPTKMKYEEIRVKSRQVCFSCEHVHGWKPGVSCDDPADISQDDGFWVIDRDKPYHPPAPLGWERIITIRSEGCSKFSDVRYTPAKGKILRSRKDAEMYLQANPDYAAGIQPSKDWFAVPQRLKDYIKRRRRQSKSLEPDKVLPLSCAPPIHEDLAPKCVLALPLYDEDQYYV